MFSNRNTWRLLPGAIHGDAPDPSEIRMAQAVPLGAAIPILY